ncbi:MAG: EamA family transporter [Proteobacteria bacterium]|nr:EamA family transporter [Pseudomonadota bacterium]
MRLLSSQHKGIFYASLSGMLYGFLAYFGMMIITEGHSSVFNMLFWRFFVTTLAFLVILIPAQEVIYDKRQILYAFGGAFFYGACAALYFVASEYIGTGLAMVIFFTYPTIVALLNWFFHRYKITLFYYISFILTAVGIFLLSDRSQMTFDFYGIFLAFLAGISYSFYMLITKKQAQNLNPILSSFVISIGNAILFLGLSLFNHSFFIPTTSLIWINIFGVSIIATVFPLFLLLMSLKYINSTKASIVSVLEPVVTVIIGVLLLHESLSWIQIIGIVVILAGTLSIQFDKNVDSPKRVQD